MIAGAALDVFSTEPMTESPLFELDAVIVTPHLGASTREAQDKAGDTIADMVELALAGEFVPFAVNVNAAEANETIRPFLPLAERLGGMFVSLAGELPTVLEICTEGEIAGYDTRILELAVLKGFFGAISDEPVTYVNAPQLAKEHGVEVRDVNCATSANYVNLLTISGGGHSISGTLSGTRSEQRIVNIDDTPFDVPPADHMVVVTNDDRPGVIGTVGTLLGNAGVNIADMDVSRVEGSGTAAMLIAPTAMVPDEILEAAPSGARHPQRHLAQRLNPPSAQRRVGQRRLGVGGDRRRGALGFGAGGFGEVGAVAGVEHRPRRADHQPAPVVRRAVLDGRSRRRRPGRRRRARGSAGRERSRARRRARSDRWRRRRARSRRASTTRWRPCRRRGRRAGGRPTISDWKSSPPGLLVRQTAITPPPWAKYGSTESVPRYGLTVTTWAP